MESTHQIAEQQALRLAQLGQAFNAAQTALQQYFSAVADGLGLPEGTRLVKVEGALLVVDEPEVRDA